ncbi:cytochrome C assembly family protein [Niveibacterium terrae]|uniref:cytochrome C assembly family protein n=1 Tax=Niveibacterium terrae TaxID=3373598 RepID=UPI003A919877
MRAILLHLVPAAIYLALALSWRLRPAARSGALLRTVLPFALLLHGAGLTLALVADGAAPRFGFSLAFSLSLWLALSFYWVESFFARIEGLQALALPLAALGALLPLIFPPLQPLANAGSRVFQLHLLVAMLAYSLLTLAALHALMMVAVQRQLHRAQPSKILAALPPLLTLESLLFRLIEAGFLLLTLTVGSGIFFSEEIFGKAMVFSHKTVFALAAWLTFAVLLAGRRIRGWRGKKALRLALAGFVFLLLAYVGTRFVLEVLLGRSG